MAASLLDVGCWDNLSGEMQPFTEVVKTLGGQSVVVVLPRELGLEVSARGQGLASLDDLVCALGVSWWWSRGWGEGRTKRFLVSMS